MSTSAMTNLHYAGIAAQVPELLRYAKARCARADMAEELVKECLIRAFTRPENFRNQSEMRSWLFITVHNLCVSEEELAGEKRPPVWEESGQQSLTHDRLMLRALDKAAMTMPRRQRQDLALMAAELVWRDNSPLAERIEIWHHRHSSTLH